jgi:adenylosuccinate synthase
LPEAATANPSSITNGIVLRGLAGYQNKRIWNLYDFDGTIQGPTVDPVAYPRVVEEAIMANPAVDEVTDGFLAFADRLRPLTVDTALLLGKALDDGKTVLLEGGHSAPSSGTKPETSP